MRIIFLAIPSPLTDDPVWNAYEIAWRNRLAFETRTSMSALAQGVTNVGRAYERMVAGFALLAEPMSRIAEALREPLSPIDWTQVR